MTGTFISLHAAARDEVRRQAALWAALGRHTRASVALELAQPPAGDPPTYQATRRALGCDDDDAFPGGPR